MAIFSAPLARFAREIERVCQMVYEVYHDFGFDEVELALSTRPEKRVGSDEIWDEAEADLQAALEAQGKPFRLQPGEGAFYRPKIDLLKDSLGRRWQCGTVQLDFSMPERLGAHYIDENDVRQTPVLIHRAILGSLERFIGILIEQYAGQMPLCRRCRRSSCPLPMRKPTTRRRSRKNWQRRGFAWKRHRNEKINYKIREHTLQRGYHSCWLPATAKKRRLPFRCGNATAGSRRQASVT